MKEYGRVLLLTLYTIIDVAAPYPNIVWSRSPSSSYHYGSTHIILCLSRFPFTTHHISYVRQGGLVVKSLKTRSRAEFFREKSSYKHPIKKPHCFGKYPGWRNPSSIPPKNEFQNRPLKHDGSFGIILGADFSLEKKSTFSSSTASLISGWCVYFLLGPANLTRGNSQVEIPPVLVPFFVGPLITAPFSSYIFDLRKMDLL